MHSALANFAFTLEYISKRISHIIIRMRVFQREGGGTISLTSPVAAVGFYLQTDRYCKV
jgi:hypothetical protein